MNLKQYKQLIYDRIKKIYLEPETPIVVEYKKSASSIHRATEIIKEKQYEARHSVNSQKSSKISVSSNKYHTPSSTTYSTLNSTVLNDEEKEKLRKKQSLK